MSSDLVRAQIGSILVDKDFSLGSPRMELAKETARHVLELASSYPSHFNLFANCLVEKLQPTGKSFGSRARKTMWGRFHALRCSDIAAIWSEFNSCVGVEEEYSRDPLFREYVNEKVLQCILESKASLKPTTTVEPTELTVDELNALRYVAGYVPFKLKKKFKKSSHPFKLEYISCLENMSEESGTCEESIQQYADKWMKLIDRGGLLVVKEEVFAFFHSVEFEVRKHLQQLLLQTGRELTKENIMDEVTNDVDVQYHWTAISSDIDEKSAQMLLREIVQLWLTIRGFSAAGAFLEQYKKTSDKAIKKSVALRKDLKRKKLDAKKADSIRSSK